MLLYYTDAMKTQQPRDDYLELLNLCHIFLGSTSDVQFRPPGGCQRQFFVKRFTCSRTTLNLLLQRIKASAIGLFVSLIYAHYWNEASLASLNDARLFAQNETYPNNYVIRDAAAKAFRRHLWYFAEHLVELSLFDPQVEITVKQAMVEKLNCSQMPENFKWLNIAIFDCNNPCHSTYGRIIIDLILKNGRDRAESFLVKDPTDWESDLVYIAMQMTVWKEY